MKSIYNDSMISVIEDVIRCPQCGRKIVFSLNDVWSSYIRGQEYCDGWCDYDCLWHYITCPYCNKTIDVYDRIEAADIKFLENKYEKEL